MTPRPAVLLQPNGFFIFSPDGGNFKYLFPAAYFSFVEPDKVWYTVPKEWFKGDTL